MQNSIRIAVIGAGAFGRNHLRVLHDLEHQTSTLEISSLKPQQDPNAGDDSPSLLKTSSLAAEHPPVLTPQVHLAAAVDADPAIRAEVAQRYSIPTFATVDDLLAANLNLSAATVAVPTIHHAAVATKLLEADLDVLVEKPLTTTLAEADALIALAAARNRILAAGHLERFNPAVTAALARLTRPMFFEAHRLSIFTPRSLDVDVVLDLMIHDLDILLTMASAANPPSTTDALVTEVRAVGLPVLSPKVDIANVRLEFRSGAVANLTASRVSTEQVRKLRFFQPTQYLSLDYARQELLTINVNPILTSTPPAKTHSQTASAKAVNPNAALVGTTPFDVADPGPAHIGAANPGGANPGGANPGVANPGPATPGVANLGVATPGVANPGVAAGFSPLITSNSIPGFSPGQPHPSAGLTFDKQALPRAEPLRLELEDFLYAAATRTQPRVTGQAARNALALALEINAAIQIHAKRAGLTL